MNRAQRRASAKQARKEQKANIKRVARQATNNLKREFEQKWKESEDKKDES